MTILPKLQSLIFPTSYEISMSTYKLYGRTTRSNRYENLLKFQLAFPFYLKCLPQQGRIRFSNRNFIFIRLNRFSAFFRDPISDIQFNSPQSSSLNEHPECTSREPDNDSPTTHLPARKVFGFPKLYQFRRRLQSSSVIRQLCHRLV